MAGPKGRLPQWWLDNTPHDTLEEQVERKKKEEAKRKEQEETHNEEEEVGNGSTLQATGGDATAAAVVQEEILTKAPDASVSDKVKAPPVLRTSISPKSVSRSTPIAGPDEYETTDYNLERARLKHVENGMSQRDRRRNSANWKESLQLRSRTEQNLTVQTSESPQDHDGTTTSPHSQADESSIGSSITPSSVSTTTTATTTTSLQPRRFQTAFTGVSPFDFAMQQRAREKERREKERLARESLARHHADRVEVDRASEQKLLNLEEKRRKQEAQENLKGFKKVSLDSAMDKSTELKRQQLEQKRKKKEAEEQHHVYKLV